MLLKCESEDLVLNNKTFFFLQIKITREGKALSLVVDDSLARKKEMVPKKMTWKNVIYVGGYSSKLSLFPSSMVCKN